MRQSCGSRALPQATRPVAMYACQGHMLEGSTMNICSTCGAQFFPQSDAWGDICGDCVASRIELYLMPGGLGQTVRKPSKRTSDKTDDGWEMAVEALRKQAGGDA
jgi:hypothetical protein